MNISQCKICSTNVYVNNRNNIGNDNEQPFCPKSPYTLNMFSIDHCTLYSELNAISHNALSKLVYIL